MSAEDKGTGNKQHIVITNDKNRLKPEDIEKMIKDAEKFKEQDESIKLRIDARSDLEQYVYSMKNQLKDKNQLGGKVSTADLTKANDAVSKAIDWLDLNKNATKEELVQQKSDIESVLVPIVSKLYDKGGHQGGPKAPPPPPESETKEEL